MAGQKQVDPGAGAAGVVSLLTGLGGTQTTTKNNGDTSGLYGVLGQLQGQEPNALLQSIFQQAAGAIPGMSARLTNAVGARSGNNSPVAALLAKTLQQTTLAGQAQVSQQQQQNLATQGQVAGDIARATNSPVTTATPNYKGAGGALAGLQLLSAAPGALKKGKELYSGLFGDSADAGSTITSDFNPVNSDITSAPNAFAGLGDALSSAAGSIGEFFSGSDAADLSEFGYADGGLVGRDKGVPYATRKRMSDAGLDEEPQEDQDRKAAIAAANKKQREQKGKPSDSTYWTDSNMVDKKTGIRFADGGEVDVRSAGGRRSSAPTYTPRQALSNTADQSVPLASMMQGDPATGNGINESDGQANANSTNGGWGKALGVIGAALTMNPVAMALSLANAVDAPANVVDGGKAVNALVSKNPLALIQALMAMNKDKDGGGGGGNTQGFNSLGQATGVDNGMGFSGLGAALAGEGAFGANGVGSEGATADNSLASVADNSMGGFGSGSGYGGFGGTNGSAGGTTGSGEGDGGSTASAANGGKIQGPGTGTSDSIKVNVSNGEYINSADVVQKLGVDFFDQLQKQFHTPVAQKTK